jgi:uncharacterized protein (DUF1810 family)
MDLGVENKTALEIMGSPDDLKLRSCMTLFESVVVDEPLFARVLSKFYGGERDARSLAILNAAPAR